jgi:hypothetical protein
LVGTLGGEFSHTLTLGFVSTTTHSLSFLGDRTDVLEELGTTACARAILVWVTKHLIDERKRSETSANGLLGEGSSLHLGDDLLNELLFGVLAVLWLKNCVKSKHTLQLSNRWS